MIELYKNHMVATTEDGEEHAVPFLANESAKTATQALTEIQSLAETIVGNVGIDDTATRTTTTWSSQKIDGELREGLTLLEAHATEGVFEIFGLGSWVSSQRMFTKTNPNALCLTIKDRNATLYFRNNMRFYYYTANGDWGGSAESALSFDMQNLDIGYLMISDANKTWGTKYTLSELKTWLADMNIVTQKDNSVNNRIITVISSDVADKYYGYEYVCSGTNDGAVINDAISKLGDGGEIHLTRGRFYITNTPITVRKPITISGEGQSLTLPMDGSIEFSATTIKLTSASSPAILMDNGVRGITLKDFQMVGLGVSETGNNDNAIRIRSYIDLLTINNVSIDNFAYGINAYGTDATLDAFSMTNCSIQRCNTCILATNIGNSRIENNIFWDCVSTSLKSTTGLAITGSNVIITGNHFGRMSFRPTTSSTYKIGYSINLDNCNGCLIANNEFLESFGTPINMVNSHDNHFTCNKFSAIGWHEFDVADACCFNVDGASYKNSITNNNISVILDRSQYYLQGFVYIANAQSNRIVVANNIGFTDSFGQKETQFVINAVGGEHIQSIGNVDG